MSRPTNMPQRTGGHFCAISAFPLVIFHFLLYPIKGGKHMYDRTEVGSRGYLTEEFRLFHLRDQQQLQLDYHYHPFDKIVIPLSGQVTYLVEGSTYYLRPWDILLVGRGEIHRPTIDLAEPYERIVLWLRPQLGDDSQELMDCFQRAKSGGPRLLRPEPDGRLGYRALLHDLEQAQHSRDFGHQVLSRTYFLQLLVFLNRQLRAADRHSPDTVRQDPKIQQALDYINSHLDQDLSAQALSQAVYLSRYHLMRRFKAVTGQTLHQYVVQKRLIRAAELLQAGLPATQASQQAGFGSYPAFLRAFRQTYHALPSQLRGGGDRPE